MAPRETGNNAYSNFGGDKQRALWYVVVFSGVVNSSFLSQLQVYKTTKIYRVHILRCLAKDMKLFTPRLKTLVSKCPVSKRPVTLIPFLF